MYGETVLSVMADSSQLDISLPSRPPLSFDHLFFVTRFPRHHDLIKIRFFLPSKEISSVSRPRSRYEYSTCRVKDILCVALFNHQILSNRAIELYPD